MSKWVGYAVSVNCGEPLGCYQGTILKADGTTITLTKAFRNGFPYPKSQVTLNAADIKELKIIEARSEPSEQIHSTVPVKSSKKCQRATVCENLQANPSSSGNQSNVNPGSSSSKSSNTRGSGSSSGVTRSKPIDIQANRSNSKNNTHTGSYGHTGTTPKGGRGGGYDKARRRNEACFGEAADAVIDDDFDFEGNLALFDKRALWERMRNAHKPDLVRQADEAGAKLRHDQNVLEGGGGGGAERRAIVVPEELRGPIEYVSDDAVVVPSVVPSLRRQIYDSLDRLGLAECTRTLLARAASDVALRLVGGTRRLEPRNAHQAPRAVALLGPHNGGAVGARCLRLLLAHGARAALHVAGGGGAGGGGGALQRELAALAMDDVRHTPLERLPSPDIVLLALYDLQVDDPQDQYAAALSWARGARAACIAVEPPPGGWGAWGVSCRASVTGALPPSLDSSLGRPYLAALAPPQRLLADLNLAYRPPFGASPVLALHAADPPAP